MLRGGRSWPSDRNIGAGDERSGNLTQGGASGTGRLGTSLTNGVIEQKAEHMLHSPEAAWLWSWS